MPDTEAGRALLGREAMNSRSFALITEEAIAAIEREARSRALAEVRERVEVELARVERKAKKKGDLYLAEAALAAVLAAIEEVSR